ncbi:MAG: acyl-CoA dehydrogenase family protein [Bacteriovoracaceae bacterium]
MNFYTDSSEWKWHFKNAIDWDSIIPLYYPTFPTKEGHKNIEEVKQFLEELLEAVGDWTANKVAPRARTLDEVGGGKVRDGGIESSKPLLELYEDAKSLELFGLTAPAEYGGLDTPVVVSLFGTCLLSRACIASSSQLAFYSSIIDMLHRFCSKELQEKYIPEIIAGNISGSMCLTEPSSGSDVGSLRTSATKQSNGTFLLNGTKCFITNGGGGLAFTLARIKGAPEGLTGISLFFVEENIVDAKTKQKKKNYIVAKNEHKLGMCGSPTCEIVYENTVATLVGEENKGMEYMFHLMNESRVGVGLQAIGGMEATLSYGREYVENRKQFGKPVSELPLMKRNLQDYETERDAFRALIADSCSYYDIYQRLDLKKRTTGDLTEAELKLFKNAKKWTRRRTPILKYYGAETFTLISQRGIQMLGGYGFMMEYDAQRFHRDSFGPLLYEGTLQIQALMAMKDLIKFIFTKPTKFLKDFI